jgi:hypothetical protein
MPALRKNRDHRALTGYRRRRLRLHLIGGALGAFSVTMRAVARCFCQVNLPVSPMQRR